MGIPFRASEASADGLAAFLRVIPFPEGTGYDGALFVMSGNGEPVEFCFSSVETPRTALWRKKDLVRRAAVELARSLMNACRSSPVLVLARAEEVGPDVLSGALELSIPVCRVARALDLSTAAPDEHEEIPAGDGLHLFWSVEPPGHGEATRRLIDGLLTSGLLAEPFDRAEAGLREVRSVETQQG